MQEQESWLRESTTATHAHGCLMTLLFSEIFSYPPYLQCTADIAGFVSTLEGNTLAMASLCACIIQCGAATQRLNCALTAVVL